MESVDKLRDYASRNQRVSGWVTALNRIADEIEREIAEMKAFCERVEKAAKAREELEVFGTAYMPLPLDADGVPIRVGDKLDYTDPFGNVFLCTVQPLLSHNPKCYRHVKPRTLEDVLTDVVTLCANAWKDDKSPFAFYDVSDVMASGNIREYADEIRELMGGDA